MRNWMDFTGLQRCGKSCRLRWTNYLRPDLKHGRFTDHEEQLIVNLHAALGSRSDSQTFNQLTCRSDLVITFSLKQGS